MSFKFFQISLLLLGLGSHTAAGAATFGCEWALRERAALGSDDLMVKSFDIDPDRSLNLKFVGHVPGQFGGRLHVVQRLNEYWSTNWQAGKNAPIGDMRNTAVILGPAAAQFFSFVKFDEYHRGVPDTTEFNLALERLNERLVKHGYRSIDLRFVVPPARGLTDDEFLFGFVYNFTLPMADEGFILIHDLSYHAPSILFDHLLQDARRVAGRIYEFTTYLKKDVPLSVTREVPDLFEFANSIENHLAKGIDAHGGNMVFVMRALADGNDLVASGILKNVLQGLLAYEDARTTDEALQFYVRDFLRHWIIAIQPAFTAYQRRIVLGILERFIRDHRQVDHEAPRVYNEQIELLKIKNRIQEIRNVLEAP